jgi:hypothetical protein
MQKGRVDVRILFVAMPNSVHTARWINQLASQGYDIHLFPSTRTTPESAFTNVKIHFAGIISRIIARFAWAGLRRFKLVSKLQLKSVPAVFDRSFWLSLVIKMVKPNIIHSLEMQHAGYLTLAARERLGGMFPTWIVTNWGSDIFLYGRLAAHVDKIKAILAACDYYSCECQRDVKLAEDMGLKGEVLPVLPNTGGFDLARVSQFRQPGPTSSRRLILLKGYQGWVGRALVGLRAIELCADVLRGYRVAIYLARNDVAIAAELVSQSTGIPIDLVPPCSHDEMLHFFGRAKIYIGLSISDAISTSLLEAMIMGAFPIQSCTSCADEWIENGKTGLIVPPEDPEIIAAAIRRAISDDALVDYAAAENMRVATELLDRSVIQPQVIAMYEKVAAQAAAKKVI